VKITINLKDPTDCAGCPCGIESQDCDMGYKSRAQWRLDVKTVIWHRERPRACIEENGL